MLNMMHASERYGYLSQNGCPIPDESISRYCGCTLQEYQTFFAELERAGVPRRTSNGIIYSKRMVDDQKERGTWRKHKKNQRDKKNPKNVHPIVQQMSDRLASPSSSPSLKEESKTSSPAKTAGGSDEFLCFWDTYPRKVDRKEALRGWVKGLCDDLLGEILASLAIWKQTEQWQDIEKVPYPSTWINKQRWKETPGRRVSLGEQKARNTDAAIERVRQRLTNPELA
jgi:hypothetical protein